MLFEEEPLELDLDAVGFLAGARPLRVIEVFELGEGLGEPSFAPEVFHAKGLDLGGFARAGAFFFGGFFDLEDFLEERHQALGRKRIKR